MSEDTLYQIALTRLPHIGPVQARILTSHFPDARSIFHARRSQLQKLEGIGEVRADSIKNFTAFRQVEEELRFIEKHGITTLFISMKEYPRRLLNCYDPPILLYYKGTAHLNASRFVAVVGTRHHTDYGRQLTEKLVEGLAQQSVSIVSGLAFGIDAIAHRACLKHRLPTIAVLAHGLDQVYPVQHKGLATEIISQGGGLLTEFCSGTPPDRHHFPSRNRIVAGLCDATIVVESGVRGGSIITAELANGYNRDVFAFPGRVSDIKSGGCHYLVQQNKAQLITGASDLATIMNWTDTKKAVPNRQKDIFVTLTPEEKKVVTLLEESGSLHIDELYLRSGLSSSTAAATVLNLEIKNVVLSLPGRIIRLT